MDGLFVTEYLEHRKRSRLPDIVDRNKERLRIRFGIEVRKEEMARRKDEIEVEQGQGSSDKQADDRKPEIRDDPLKRKDCRMGKKCCKKTFRF